MNKMDDFSGFARRLRIGEVPVQGASDYRRISRSLNKIAGDPDVRIALMGNTTLDPLVPFLTVELARRNLRGETYVSPFGQYVQDLTAGTFTAFGAQMILLHLSLPLLRPDRVHGFAELSNDERRLLRDDVLDEVERWVALALAKSTAAIMVCNFPIVGSPALGIADMAEEYGETEFLHSLNLALLHRLRPHPRVQILDLERAVAKIGIDKAFDARFMHMAKTDWTDALLAEVGKECVRHVVAASGRARKCLVLDLDNTLWGGVLGEDGADGIHVAPGDAQGEAFHAFQRRIRALKRRGILLALCSKNDPALVEQAFGQHPDMPLQLCDFSARAIGWEPKSAGLASIAAQLNIGVDSLVFMDDNPAEIAEVCAALPDVESVLLPRDPADYVATLDNLPSFEKSRLGAEDAARSRLYAEAATRAAAIAISSGPGDYLADLDMTVTIWRATSADTSRVHQLLAKTNQFNVTTKRYSVAEVQQFIDAPDCRLTVCSLRDRFGDFGTIGLCLALREDDVLRIDSFVMSCRALGRGVEAAFLGELKQHASGETDGRAITARFVPTERNAPAAHFFDEAGFSARPQAGHTDYEFDCADIQWTASPWLTVKVG